MVLEFILNNKLFVAFILFLTIFLIIKRKKVEVQGSFPLLYIIMYKTSLGLGKMKSWSTNYPRLFLYLSYLSIFVGIAGGILVFIFMFWQLGFIIENQLTTGGGLVLPIETSSGLDGAVPVFYIPFFYWIVALAILVIVHEFAHGVIAERFKVKIKSSGFAFFGILAPILPAAFVEPDQKQLDKKPSWQKIAVYGAGSTSNFIFGFLFLLIWLFLAVPFVNNTMEPESIRFVSVMNESGLMDYNISSGEILAVNGIDSKNELLYELRTLDSNSTVNLTIDTGNETLDVSILTFENSLTKRGMIGINLDLAAATMVNKEGKSFYGQAPIVVEQTLFYLWFLNIAIGMINLLPIWITDGGQIMYELLRKGMRKRRALFFYHFISFISLFLIIFTMWPRLLF